MSIETSSPHRPYHMSTQYGQPQQQPGGPPVGAPPMGSLGDSAQANRSYQDSDAAAGSAPESPALATPPVTKGKNGATGPAEGKPKPHVCPICQRGFTTGGHLQRHQRIHTGIKAFKCPYPGCETRTSRQDNLQQHYRTHLSPTLRRGSGTAARQAVAAAMMAAGLKSSTSRQPRKSKGSGAGTPGSSSGASAVHGQSPYQTPTQSTAPYASYMYADPNQHGGYPGGYALPPPGVSGMGGANPQSAQSSRVPSPVNGHSSAGSIPATHHQQPYFNQQFSPAYAYPSSTYGQPPYPRYGAPPAAMQSPYASHPSHHSMYSQGIAPEHSQQHMYSPLQTGFPHSRDSQYSGMLTQGGYAGQAPMGNAYPPRTQSSTPLNGTHADELDPRYRGGAGGAPRAQSPRSSASRRLTPPHQAETLAASVVDPAHMSTAAGQQAAARTSVGGTVPASYAYSSYAYGSNMGPPRDVNAASTTLNNHHRQSASSLTEEGINSDSKAFIKHE